MLTDVRLCNVNEQDIRRSIDIAKIMGLTKNQEKGSNEFLVHVKAEYDYKFTSTERELIIKHIMLSFKAKTGLELPIFGVHGKLELFQTTAKDKMSGVVRCLPSQSCRLHGKAAFNIEEFKSLCPVMANDSASDAEWRSKGKTSPEVHASFIQNLFRGKMPDKEDEKIPKKKSLSANPSGVKSSQSK